MFFFKLGFSLPILALLLFLFAFVSVSIFRSFSSSVLARLPAVALATGPLTRKDSYATIDQKHARLFVQARRGGSSKYLSSRVLEENMDADDGDGDKKVDTHQLLLLRQEEQASEEPVPR